MVKRDIVVENNIVETNEYGLSVGQEIYYAQMFSRAGVFNVIGMKIRTLYPTYFVALDVIDKVAYLFDYTDIDRCIFTDRKDALDATLIAEDEFYNRLKTNQN